VGTVMLVFWAIIGAMALVELIIIITALRTRVQYDPSRGLVGDPRIEVVWVLLPVLILIFVAVLSFQSLREEAESSVTTQVEASAGLVGFYEERG
jgi:heme/copper-type cytochrome/quinol oxidase subunit 2